jgi:hypothetical protein
MKWEGFRRNQSWPNCKILSWHVSGGTDANHRKRQSEYPLSRLKFEPGTSRTGRRNTNHSDVAFSEDTDSKWLQKCQTVEYRIKSPSTCLNSAWHKYLRKIDMSWGDRLWGGGVDWIRLTHDRDRWRAVVSAVMNLLALGFGGVWIGFDWFMTGTGGGLLWALWWTFWLLRYAVI